LWLNDSCQLAIQFARLSGFSPIIVTASSHNTELLKSLGATHIIPRSLPLSSFASEIANITSEPVEVVYDAVSFPETQAAGLDVLAMNGTLVLVGLSTEETKEKAGSRHIVQVFGSFALPGHQELGYALSERLPACIADGSFKASFTSSS
jgi:NADPH:quinone reductase-like Zn-dependent oxidoreductase